MYKVNDNNLNYDLGQAPRETVVMEEKENGTDHMHRYQQQYAVLRQAYEDRVLQMADVIKETCEKLLSDEILAELKGDRTSAAFIPAHIAEVISSSLHSEREGNAHNLLQKISVYELERKNLNESIDSLKQQVSELLVKSVSSDRAIATLVPAADDLEALQRRHTAYAEETQQRISALHQQNETLQLRERQLVNQLEIVRQELADSTAACHQLEHQLAAKDRDLSTLEQSFDDASRGLAMIENMEKQEQVHKAELKDLVMTLTEERNALHDENQQLRAKMQYACDELDRCHTLAAQKETDEASNKQRLAELMAQVEGMLTQEASDSNAAINAVHDKMKAFRLRMSTELHKEKRFAAALQEELQTARVVKEECQREHHHLAEQEALLREQLHGEQQRGAALQRQLQEEVQQGIALKARAAEAQAQATSADAIRRDYERLKALETQLVAEQAELKSEKSRESQQQQLDKRMEAYKLHYENELVELRKQLKSAYAFDKSGKASTAVDASSSSEISYQHTIQSWVQENARLKQRHSAELAVVATRMKGEYEGLVRQLQGRLEEASANLDKLKDMVRSGRATSKAQAARIESLTTDNHRLKHQLESVASAAPASPAWNNSSNAAGGSNSKRSVSAAASSTQRRSSLSSADISREVESHRAAVFRRSFVSSHPPSVSSSAGHADGSSTPPQSLPQRGGASPGASPPPTSITNMSRRSSTSVLGTSRFVSPNTSAQWTAPAAGSSKVAPPSSLLPEEATLLRQELNKARDEANTARLAERRGTEELARVKGQCERLLQDAKAFDSTVRGLQDQLASRPTESSFGQALDDSVLQAKVREINTLRQELSSLRQSFSASALEKEAEVAALRRALDDLQTKHAEAVAAHKAARRDHEDAASTTFSDESSCSGGEVDRSSGDNGALRENHASREGMSLYSVVPQRAFDTSAFEASMVQLEESLQHQVELTRISTEELAQERLHVREVRQREVKLFQLLGAVERAYRGQIHGLRKDLQEVRSIVQALGSAAQVEVRKTVSSLALQLDRLFREKDKAAQEEVRHAHIALSNAHVQEMNLLEARFVEQLELQATTHTLEMDRLHTELVTRAESALGLTLLSDGASLEEDSLASEVRGGEAGGGDTYTSTNRHRQQRSVSFASESSDVRHVMGSSGGRQRRHSTLSALPATRRSEASNSNSSGGRSGAVPAYESVATGVLEALKDEEIVDQSGVQQVLSLARAHQEPSFAAQAAAKSIVAGFIEKFVNAQHERIRSAFAETSATSSTSISNNNVSRLTYTGGADYSVFFE